MSADPFFLKSVESLWVLGLLPAGELPDVALDAMERGFQSPLLIELGGLPEEEMAEAPRLFEEFLKAIHEGGDSRLGKAEAMRHYATMICASIVTGTVPPRDGAERLGRVLRQAGLADFQGRAVLDSLVAASDEETIRAEAARWVEAGRSPK